MSVGPIVNAPATPGWTTEDRSNPPAPNAPAQQASPQAPQPPPAPKVPQDVRDLADELNRERARLKTLAGRPQPEISAQIKLIESLYGKLSDAQDRHIKTGDWNAPDLPRKVQDLK